MEIIAKTSTGFIIQATEREVAAIISAVTGTKPEENKIPIGQKLPAIDYSATITKMRTLKDDYYFKQLLSALDTVNDTVGRLKTAVHEASQTEL